MAQIEQRPFACFALITCHHLGFMRTGLMHRLRQQGFIPLHQPFGMLLQPAEEGLVTDQTVFNDFRHARRHFARRQGIQRIQIGQHQFGLIKRTNHVLAQRMVDSGLAAYRGIHLREQGGRHLNKGGPALIAGCGKTDQISNDAPAQRNERGATLAAVRQQGIKHRI